MRSKGIGLLARTACLAGISLAGLLPAFPAPADPPASPPPGVAVPKTVQDVKIAYLGRRHPSPPLYDYESLPGDAGIQGARIAMRDMKTTGRLTGQNFTLDEVLLNKSDSAVDAAKALVDKGEGLIVTDLPAQELLAVSDALKGKSAALFNISAAEDSLRGADCRANVYHFAPSRSMLTDALIQFLLFKQWRKAFLISGKEPTDKLYADAVRGSAKKFGVKLVGDKEWEFGNLARQRADGPTQADALVFSRGSGADVIIVADEEGNFGDYIQYHTAEPKLVVGTQGLVPTTWSHVLDSWGSAQLQSRFVRTNKRTMRPLDYQAWTAIRAVGEAATRAKSADPKVLSDYIMHPDFDIAAFKGVPVSMRDWDRQLRQPILIVQPKMLVSVAPEPGFLHPVSALDTLGSDGNETACKIPSGGKS